jgi:hypothetical protein
MQSESEHLEEKINQYIFQQVWETRDNRRIEEEQQKPHQQNKSLIQYYSQE